MPKRIEVGGHQFELSRYDGWEAKIPMRGWSAYGSSVELSVFLSCPWDDEGNTKAEPPSSEQLVALEYFLGRQDQIASAVLTATLTYVKERFKEQSEWYTNICIEPKSEAQLLGMIQEPSLIIHRQSVDGCSWIGMTSGCDWEDEHGLGVALWKELVLDVGYSDVASDGCWIPTQPGENLDHIDDERRRVMSVLGTQVQAEEEAANKEMLASLPPSVRLAQAILMGNLHEAKQLLDQGVDINALSKPYEPAIFMAMNSQDPEKVAEMIKAGASVHVKNQQRQTPLQLAKQMVQMHSLGSQMRAGSPGAMNAMMSNLFGGQSLFGDGSRDEPLKQMQKNLDELDAQGGMFGAIAGHMQNMLNKLSGGFPERSKNASPQEREYLENIQREGELMLSNWTKILQLIEERVGQK